MTVSSPIEQLQQTLEHEVSRLTRLLTQPVWQAEDCHDFRVCARTLLSACPLLALANPWRPSLAPQLKALILASNALRDWEVRLAWLARWPEATRWQQRLLAQRPTGSARPDAEASRRLLAGLSAQRQDLARALRLPWDAWLACYQAQAAERVMASYERLQAGKPARYHGLRLAIKRLRYLRWLLGGTVDQLAPLRHWQTALGEISDLTGLADWLKQQGSHRLRREVAAASRLRQVRLLGQRQALWGICQAATAADGTC